VPRCGPQSTLPSLQRRGRSDSRRLGCRRPGNPALERSPQRGRRERRSTAGASHSEDRIWTSCGLDGGGNVVRRDVDTVQNCWWWFYRTELNFTMDLKLGAGCDPVQRSPGSLATGRGVVRVGALAARILL